MIAAKNDDRGELIWETTDLLYHCWSCSPNAASRSTRSARTRAPRRGLTRQAVARGSGRRRTGDGGEALPISASRRPQQLLAHLPRAYRDWRCRSRSRAVTRRRSDSSVGPACASVRSAPDAFRSSTRRPGRRQREHRREVVRTRASLRAFRRRPPALRERPRDARDCSRSSTSPRIACCAATAVPRRDRPGLRGERRNCLHARSASSIAKNLDRLVAGARRRAAADDRRGKHGFPPLARRGSACTRRATRPRSSAGAAHRLRGVLRHRARRRAQASGREAGGGAPAKPPAGTLRRSWRSRPPGWYDRVRGRAAVCADRGAAARDRADRARHVAQSADEPAAARRRRQREDARRGGRDRPRAPAAACRAH